MKIKVKTTILIASLILVLALLVTMATVGYMSTAKAEVASGEAESGEVSTAPEEESNGNWFSENWKAIVEIITSSGALAVIFAIIKLFGKIAKLRGDLGSTNTDNKAIKEAFNTMVDEVEGFRKELEEIHKWNAILKSEVATSGEKSSAVLAIFEKLIGASDLPSETKQAMQAVINKATIGEDKSNDEA